MKRIHLEFRPLGMLLLLFILLPIAEVAAIVAVGKKIGTLRTLGLMVATGIAGAWLARLQGLSVLHAISRDLALGRIPADSLLDGVLVLVGGICLISPGFVTDAIGLLLMFPPVRKAVTSMVKAQIISMIL